MMLSDSPRSLSAAAKLKQAAFDQLALGDGAAAFEGLSAALAVLPDDGEVAFHLGTLPLDGHLVVSLLYSQQGVASFEEAAGYQSR